MNFLEAMATGKRFKRKDWSWYTTGIVQGQPIPFTAEGCSVYWVDGHHVSAEELLANDWEVEEETTTITYKQLYDAYVKTRSEISTDDVAYRLWRNLGGSK